jgi:hypothetical protein
MSTDEIAEQAFGSVSVAKRECLTLRQAGLVIAFSHVDYDCGHAVR